MQKNRALTLIILLAGMTPAQGIERIAAPVDWVTLAVSDAAAHEDDARFLRWIALPSWQADAYAIASQVINEVISRNGVVVNPPVIGAEGVYLVRLDLRTVASKQQDLTELASAWEKLEPVYFPYKTATIDIDQTEGSAESVLVQFRSPSTGKLHARRCELVSRSGGRITVRLGDREIETSEKFLVEQAPEIPEVARQDNLQLTHLGPLANTLPELTRSEVPIIRLDVLTRQAYTSRDESGLPGLYYEFTGIDGLGLNELLAKLGANPQDGNTTKVGILRSDVTGQERVVEYTTGNKVRPSAGSGRVAITHDASKEQRGLSWLDDIDRFLREANAHEIIYQRPNGTHGYAIYQGQNQLDTVPDSVAKNHRISSPGYAGLSAGAGCLHCHSAPVKTSGWIRAKQDMKELLEGSEEYRKFVEHGEALRAIVDGSDLELLKVGLNARNDLQQNLSARSLETFAEQFGADELWHLAGDQESYERAVKLATFKSSETVSRAVVGMVNSYESDLIDAKAALRDIGYEPGENPKEDLRAIFGRAVNLEDPVFTALKAGKGIDRGLWENKYPLAARRSANALMLKR